MYPEALVVLRLIRERERERLGEWKKIYKLVKYDEMLARPLVITVYVFKVFCFKTILDV